MHIKEEQMALSSEILKDPKDIKQKFIGSFTKRQIICFSLAAVIGVPFYFMTRKSLGTDAAALLMMAIMLPFFFFAIYEKEGVHAEVLLVQMINMTFIRAGIRDYKPTTRYDEEKRIENMKKEVEALEEKRGKWKEGKKNSFKKNAH